LLLAPHAAAQGVVFQTSFAPKPEENIATDCRYEVTIPNPSRSVRAVWVIFDRGRDMLRYYTDPDVQAFAFHNDLALLFPFHCWSKTYEDMDVEPSSGIGRALFAALSQLAQSSGHQELASAKVILLGFSGAGSLVARLTGYAPERLLPRAIGNNVGSAGGLSAISSSSGYCLRSGSGTFTFVPFRMLMSCKAFTT